MRKRVINSDELNFMVWRYMQESGYKHSSFSFQYESKLNDTLIKGEKIKSGSLISLIQRGIQYLEVERKLLNEKQPNFKLTYQSPYELLYPGVRKRDFLTVEKKKKKKKKKEKKVNPFIITKNEVTLLRGHEHEVFVCAWCPIDSHCLASGSGDSTARIWRLHPSKTGAEASKFAQKEQLTLLHSDPNPNNVGSKDVTTLDWSKNGLFLATGSYDGKARIWEKSGKLLCVLCKHQGPIFSLKWSKSGKFLLSGSVDNTAIVWDTINGCVKHQFNNHRAPVLDVDWKDEEIFATCSTDRTITICKIGDPRPLRIYYGHTDEVNAIKWSPNGKYLASCSDDYTAKIWDIEDDHYVLNFTEHQKEIYTVKWSPTGPGTKYPNKKLLLATASFDSTIKIWDVSTGKCVYTLDEHSDPVYSVCFSPDGNYLCSGSFDSRINIWNVRMGNLVKTFQGTGSIFEVVWNCTGDKIAACFSNSVQDKYTVGIIDFPQGKILPIEKNSVLPESRVKKLE